MPRPLQHSAVRCSLVLRNVAKLKNDLSMLFLDDQLHFLENHLAFAMTVFLTASGAFSFERPRLPRLSTNSSSFISLRLRAREAPLAHV
jgi:hypothetical protein